MATIADPLWRLTKKDVRWVWKSVEQAAFDKLKGALSTDSMAFCDKTWLTRLIVDASPVGLGAVLVQEHPKDKTKRHIASRALTDVERRYSQCEKEALATVWGCERFWYYLFGQSFPLVTDNRGVELIFKNTAAKPPARIER